MYIRRRAPDVVTAMSDNVSKMQEMYAAFGRGDIATILDNVTDDVTWGTDTVINGEIPWYRIRSGREGVADFFATLAREIDFEKFEPVSFVGSDDTVYVHVDYQYKFRKNGAGAPTQGVHQYKMREGKVAQFRAFEDTAAILDAWNG